MGLGLTPRAVVLPFRLFWLHNISWMVWAHIYCSPFWYYTTHIRQLDYTFTATIPHPLPHTPLLPATPHLPGLSVPTRTFHC